MPGKIIVFMSKQSLKIFRHLPYMALITLIVMMIVEYLGWKIIQHSTGDFRFPGFLSREVLASVFMNSLGTILFGVLFSAISLIIPSLRKNWRQIIHIPVWIGIVVFNLYMIILVSIGLNAL